MGITVVNVSQPEKVIVEGAANIAPPGPPGRGIVSIEDEDGDGTATVTYTDSSTSSLTLPSGGGGGLEGVGQPNGVVTATPGTVYTDTAGTNGAWKWLKTSGTGNTGWVVMYGDTGGRNVTNLLSGTDWSLTLSNLVTQRVGNVVTLTGNIRCLVKDGSTYLDMFGMPPGFRPQAFLPATLVSMDALPPLFTISMSGTGWLYVECASPGLTTVLNINLSFSYLTSDPWPTTLPGVPA